MACFCQNSVFIVSIHPRTMCSSILFCSRHILYGGQFAKPWGEVPIWMRCSCNSAGIRVPLNSRLVLLLHHLRRPAALTNELLLSLASVSYNEYFHCNAPSDADNRYVFHRLLLHKDAIPMQPTAVDLDTLGKAVH